MRSDNGAASASGDGDAVGAPAPDVVVPLSAEPDAGA
jgi:hypothetical protein